MKAMILAAGLGTRMRPLTLETPKPLLSVGDKPLIVWHIEALKQAGITDIVINCAWLADKLMGALDNGSQFGVNIHWSVEAEALETAGGIIQALPVLGAEPFVLVNGDVWTRFDYSQLITHSLANDLAHLVLVDNPPQHPAGDFMLANGRIYNGQVDLPASAQAEAQKLTFSGLSVLSPKLFNDLPEGKRPLAPLLRQAMQQALVSGTKMNSAWVDVGTPERLNILDQQIRQQQI
ncbi:nucleotidyl transferase [Alkanindiges hydrocarboniclasticus]|uniref:Nucleotidyl transferase n=1 Tax=Alkanindiges hydrocarboniclasticus TaxID=1907941 RepID=A0A1S8CSL3_9GAMM|nr:nucleotidyltransferase family protein [Alkanindiges hydrocarboniclasticus]ONG38965.1 nucleotidyl transferase [Alkanindiges hydrocarboniclasticus]